MTDPVLFHRSSRRCAECGATLMRGEGGILVQGRLFCSEECADAYEGDLTTREIDEMYPEWSGAFGTTLDGF